MHPFIREPLVPLRYLLLEGLLSTARLLDRGANRVWGKAHRLQDRWNVYPPEEIALIRSDLAEQAELNGWQLATYEERLERLRIGLPAER